MEDAPSLLDSLVERVEDYGKTSFELLKLKTLDKTSEVASLFVSRLLVAVTVSFFLLFVSLGIAYWLGELLGKIYYGFMIVAALYGISGLVVYFFMNKWIRRLVSNSIIQYVLN
jgi:hypothetical protein